jgi:hypothetical protein
MVKGCQFTAIAHAIRPNKLMTANKENTLADLEAQNPFLKGRMMLSKVVQRKKAFKDSKLHTPLWVDVRILVGAKTLVLESLLHHHKVQICKFLEVSALLQSVSRARTMAILQQHAGSPDLRNLQKTALRSILSHT